MKRALKSLFTDGEWDADVTKVLGVILILVGLVGWWFGRDPTFVIGFGSALAATGKFSSQG